MPSGKEEYSGYTTMIPIPLNRVIIVRVLWATATFFVLVNIAAQCTRYLAGYGSVYGLVPLFDLDEENNLPTYFSASLLLLAAVLLWIITIFKRRSGAPFASKWTVLAWAFLYLAVDEAASLHELLIRPTQEFLGPKLTGGIFVAAWVIPALGVTLPFALLLRRFLLHLPKKVRSLFLLAGSLHMAGAVGVEMIGLRYLRHHTLDLTYSMFVTLEESLEISGVIVFIHALLLYIEANYPEVRLRFAADGAFSEGHGQKQVERARTVHVDRVNVSESAPF